MATWGMWATVARRMDELESAIRARDWEQVEWQFDRAMRAILKASKQDEEEAARRRHDESQHG